MRPALRALREHSTEFVGRCRRTRRKSLTRRKVPTYHPVVPDADTFAVLANPTRRKLLELLNESPATAGHLAEQFDLSRPAISEHLSVLRKAHLVRDRVDGRERIYELDAGPLADVNDWLRPFERYWRDQLSRLSDHLDKETET